MRYFGAFVLLVLALAPSRIFAQEGPANANKAPITVERLAPGTLPGKGLAHHDILYAGEGSKQRMYIVRNGAVVWSYANPDAKGEISDAVLMSNGNILFAHQFG